jgi:hypothetical protein
MGEQGRRGRQCSVERESDPENVSLAGQLGHRDQDEMLKDNDSDFPEPDAQAEHSGDRTWYAWVLAIGLAVLTISTWAGTWAK